jgi:hypothetical protein
MNTKKNIQRFADMQAKKNKALGMLSEVEFHKFQTLQKKELDALAESVLNDAKKDYAEVYNAFNRAAQSAAEARENYQNGLDYQRLNYAQETVKASIAGARDGRELAQAYETAKGDNYKVLAWGEIGVGLLDSKPLDMSDKAMLTSRIKADYAEAATPSELSKAREAVTAKGWEAWQLREDLVEAVGLLDSYSYFMTAEKLRSIAGKVQRETRLNTAGGYDATFTLEKPE